MPTYGYKCPHCNKTRDVFKSIKDDNPVYCLLCGKQMSRLISGGQGHQFDNPRGTFGGSFGSLGKFSGRTKIEHS